MRQNLGAATSRARDYVDKTYADALSGAFTPAVIHASTNKTTPVDADELLLLNSAGSFAVNRTTIANLKALIYAYIVGAAPGALDTLDELAAAINDDANFASTVTTLLAAKASLAGTETLTNKTLTNPTITNYTETKYAGGNTGTAKTIDLANGTMQTFTLTGNCTFTLPAQPGAGQSKSLTVLLNTGAGGFTATFTGVKWPASTAPTITTTAARLDIVSLVADGTNWYGSAVQNYTP